MNLPPKNRPSKDQRTIVFVTFETGLAPSGGLAAVMKVLPRQMARHEKCFVLAPYFRNISRPQPVLRTFPLAIRGKEYSVEIRQAAASDGSSLYLLASEGFFTAPSDPYVNPEHPDKLVEDVLFFCAAVPKALLEIARHKQVAPDDLILHLQDWETACVAQAVRQRPDLKAVACVLTLHNPYDRYLSPASFPLVNDLVSHLGLDFDNVLSQMIPLMDGPLSTVSQNFADELTSDPLHSHVFAPHLQGLLASKGVVGVDNGIFGQLTFPFSEEARALAEQGSFERIQQEKWMRREKLAEVLAAYQRQLSQDSEPGRQAWGEDLDLFESWIPVFLFMGRDDPRQKGFSVAAEAI
ncbi:MAG: glycogen/starch synthase, partial [Anaerolineae bacterium]